MTKRTASRSLAIGACLAACVGAIESARATEVVVAPVDVHLVEIDGCGLARDVEVVVEAQDGTRWTQRVAVFAASPETAYGKPRKSGGWWDYDAHCATAQFDAIPFPDGVSTLRVSTTSPAWRIEPETWTFDSVAFGDPSARRDLHVVLEHRHVVMGRVLAGDTREWLRVATIERVSNLPRLPLLREHSRSPGIHAGPVDVDSLASRWWVDGTGRFAFEWPVREVTVRVSADGYLPKPSSLRLGDAIEASAAVATVALQPDPVRAVIEIEATWADGEPARRGVVEVALRVPAEFPFDELDASSDLGAYWDDVIARARGLDGASIVDGTRPIVLDDRGRGRVIVRVPGIVDVRVTAAGVTGMVSARVDPGSTVTVNPQLNEDEAIEMPFEPALGKPTIVAGVVIGEISRKGLRAEVQVREPEGRWGKTVATDDDGCFVAEVWNGSWLRVRCGDYPERIVRWDGVQLVLDPIVIRGARPGRFTLAGTVRVPGALRGAKGVRIEAISDNEVKTMDSLGAPADGAFIFSFDTPGLVMLRADAGCLGTERMVEVRDVRGLDDRVELELKPLVPVVIRVFGATDHQEIKDAAFDRASVFVDGTRCVLAPLGDIAYVFVTRPGTTGQTLGLDARENRSATTYLWSTR